MRERFVEENVLNFAIYVGIYPADDLVRLGICVALCMRSEDMTRVMSHM